MNRAVPVAAAVLALSFAASCGGDHPTGVVPPPAPPPPPPPPSPSNIDFAIVGAQFTQGVQTPSGTIPIVLGGNAAVVNVLVKSTNPSAASMQVVLRLLGAGGALVRSDTAISPSTSSATSSFATPTAQFLVPASVLKPGLTWEVIRDPKGLVPDDSAANDKYPRTGPAALNTIQVPPLKIRFVPIVQAASGNVTGAITENNLPEYLRTVRSIEPLGTISAHVGPPFTTMASFGSPPKGGDAAFWQQVVSELDLARIADPVEPDANWYGILVPPPAFNFTTYGGFSYIPSSGAATGPGTRTSASVQLNWFFNQTQARDLVAHELGHTFGRLHAPCGDAAAPLDPNYPIPGGRIDQIGHDVYSWETGRSNVAATVPVSTGDAMGYCFPVWSSTYTYSAIVQFRSTAATSAREPQSRTRVLVVRGKVNVGQSIELQPAFVLDARPSAEDPSGRYVLAGLTADGRTLFEHRFSAAVLDHAPDLQDFLVALPSTSDVENGLATIVVRGPEGEARMSESPANPAVIGEPALKVSAQRMADGLVNVSCNDATTRGILLLDEATGSVLGTASARMMRSLQPRGSPMSVVCSDGVKTHRVSVIAP